MWPGTVQRGVYLTPVPRGNVEDLRIGHVPSGNDSSRRCQLMGRATGEISHDDGRHPLWGRPDHGDFAVVRLWVPN